MTEFTDAADPAEPSLPHDGEGKQTSSLITPRVMRRRRSFVAEPLRETDSTEPSSYPTPETEDEDLPVLTEVVSVETAVPEHKVERLDEAQISLLASVITHAIEQQLTNDLPALLESALHNAGEGLRAGIAVSMENALHDVLSRYK